MAATQRVTRRLTIPAPVGRTWRAVTDGAWLGTQVRLDARPGGDGLAIDECGILRRIHVASVDEGRRLSFHWWPVGSHALPADGPTQVDVTLEPVGDETVVTVTEEAIEAVPAPAEATAGAAP